MKQGEILDRLAQMERDLLELQTVAAILQQESRSLVCVARRETTQIDHLQMKARLTELRTIGRTLRTEAYGGPIGLVQTQ